MSPSLDGDRVGKSDGVRRYAKVFTANDDGTKLAKPMLETEAKRTGFKLVKNDCRLAAPPLPLSLALEVKLATIAGNSA